MSKVVIVDDDSFSRKILRNLLAKFDCEIFEAENGVEALDLIYKVEPDLVLLDVIMPVLDGLATLEEIRSSGHFARLPVVAVSAQAERSLVMRFIDLGITNFLVKPLKPQDTLKRLDAVLKNLHNPRVVTAGREEVVSDRPLRIVLGEMDPNFRQFAGPMLENRCELIEVSTGAAAWQAVTDQHPDVIIVGESLQLIGPQRLLQMVRELSGNNVKVFLLSESECPEISGAWGQFDGSLRRSFVPEIFSAELARKIFGQGDVPDALRTLVRGELVDELVTATRQSIGVLTSQDVTHLKEEETEASREVQVTARLSTAGGEAGVIVGWASTKENAERVGGRILMGETTLEDGAGDAIGELANTIAGRVRASLAEKGFAVEQQSPEVAVDVAEPREWDVILPFATESDDRFVVAVAVEESSVSADVSAAA